MLYLTAVRILKSAFVLGIWSLFALIWWKAFPDDPKHGGWCVIYEQHIKRLLSPEFLTFSNCHLSLPSGPFIIAKLPGAAGSESSSLGCVFVGIYHKLCDRITHSLSCDQWVALSKDITYTALCYRCHKSHAACNTHAHKCTRFYITCFYTKITG